MMNESGKTTQRNWEALKRNTLRLFKLLLDQDSILTYDSLREHLELPDTKLFRELAAVSGIPTGDHELNDAVRSRPGSKAVYFG